MVGNLVWGNPLSDRNAPHNDRRTDGTYIMPAVWPLPLIATCFLHPPLHTAPCPASCCLWACTHVCISIFDLYPGTVDTLDDPCKQSDVSNSWAVSFASKVSQIGPKWDKSETFSDHISVYFGLLWAWIWHPWWTIVWYFVVCTGDNQASNFSIFIWKTQLLNYWPRLLINRSGCGVRMRWECWWWIELSTPSSAEPSLSHFSYWNFITLIWWLYFSSFVFLLVCLLRLFFGY